MSKVFAMEHGPHGIRVNVISPGYIGVRGWSDAHPDRAPDDLAVLLFTSGTAGTPRAARLTHGNLGANIAQVQDHPGLRVEAHDDLRAALVRSIPLGQAGHPRDIASAVLVRAAPRLTTERKPSSRP